MSEQEQVILYYNPGCSKCQYALEFLQEKGITPHLIEYLTNTPTVEMLREITGKLGLRPIDIIRVNEIIFVEKFSNTHFSDDELFDLIIQYPVLLQRPILVKGNSAVIARSPEALNNAYRSIENERQ